MITIDRIRTLFRVAPNIEVSGKEIHDIVGGWHTGWLYVALSRLERSGELVSRFEDRDDGKARRRLYRRQVVPS